MIGLSLRVDRPPLKLDSFRPSPPITAGARPGVHRSLAPSLARLLLQVCVFHFRKHVFIKHQASSAHSAQKIKRIAYEIRAREVPQSTD